MILFATQVLSDWEENIAKNIVQGKMWATDGSVLPEVKDFIKLKKSFSVDNFQFSPYVHNSSDVMEQAITLINYPELPMGNIIAIYNITKDNAFYDLTGIKEYEQWLAQLGTSTVPVFLLNISDKNCKFGTKYRDLLVLYSCVEKV